MQVPQDVSSLQMDEATLWTFTGLAGILPFLVQGVKYIAPKLVEGREKLLTVVLALIIGVGAKLTVPGAFENASWIYAVIGFFGSALGAMGVYSVFIAPISKKKRKETKSQSMVGTASLPIAILLTMSLSGCALFKTPDASLVYAVDAHVNETGMLDEYDLRVTSAPSPEEAQAYIKLIRSVADGDPLVISKLIEWIDASQLTDNGKSIRKGNSDELRAFLRKAKSRLE